MIPTVTRLMLAASSSLAASIVVKATATIALGLLGTWLTRRSRAAVRHALLAAAFGVLLLLPMASVVAPPVRIAVQEQTAPPAIPSTAPTTPLPASAGPSLNIVPSVPRSSAVSLTALLIPVWIFGAVVSLLPMAISLWRVRCLRRSALPWISAGSLVETLGVSRRVEVLVHEAVPGPMTCGVVHPAVVLPPDARTWTPEDLSRALVHELEHVRRADWVSHCLARIACAMYWFHPLVWMAWRRLSLEAERSCDDAVLRRSEATAYADQLVGLAERLSTAAGTAQLAMANRGDLAARVHALLDSRQPRGRAGALLVALIGVVAVCLVFTFSPLRVIASPQAAVTQEFDAVSVKLTDPNSHGEHIHEGNFDPVRFSLTSSMHWLIMRSYGLVNGQLSGEPDWFQTRLYSIDAVASAPATHEQQMLMLRKVLADRFQLKLRQEDREMPAYVLEVAPGGPKFKELKPGEKIARDPDLPDGMYGRVFNSVQDLMNTLNHVFGGELAVDRPVVDRTSLTGNYGMKLETEISREVDAAGHRSTQFPNLFHDLQAQLGLRLVSAKVKMPSFVVEHAAFPTPN